MKTKKNFGFNGEEIKIFKKLNTPSKIQDYLNSLKINFEEGGNSFMSPRMVLKTGKAHCIEGALLAAAALRFHGNEPLIVDMEANDKDDDHVIAVFKKNGFWGAVGKTNHAVLRYREPVYKDIRELVMSFFHEYTLDKDGSKTLRRFSMPVNLKKFDKLNWMTLEEDVWFIPEFLTTIPHEKILTLGQIRSLRKADEIERRAGRILEFKKK